MLVYKKMTLRLILFQFPKNKANNTFTEETNWVALVRPLIAISNITGLNYYKIEMTQETKFDHWFNYSIYPYIFKNKFKLLLYFFISNSNTTPYNFFYRGQQRII